MLVIRDAQMSIFRSESKLRLEQDLVYHFLRTYPRECRQAGGEAQIAKVVSAGMDKAEEFGFKGRAELSLFIALGFILGCDFYRDPQIPWAAEILNDRRKIRNASLRINAVYDQMLEYLGATAGENALPVVKALIRLRDWDINTAPVVGASWEDEMLALFQRLYPQKTEHQGEEANRFLLHDALAKCDMTYEIRSRQGKALMAILMFMLGSGFDHDHLHPWAARILKSPQYAKSEAERIAALYKASFDHLQQSLTSDELKEAVREQEQEESAE
ncbi:hypothetical protein F183_A10720 [Bryobacterales bacterium F-183]|nr:hypothetical protein F183_A10720 [Bryobacterales bacterium F-183]